MCGIVQGAIAYARPETTEPEPEPEPIATADLDLFADGLDASTLADRLGYSQASGVSRPAKIISADEFAARTKAKDPEGIAWKWNGEEGNKIRFFPVGDRA